MSGDHFYTTSAAERDAAIANAGYQSEGTACHVYDSATPGTTPLYRLFQQDNGDHFYTTSTAERDAAVANAGYQSEGIACHVYDSAGAATTPLYRMWQPAVTGPSGTFTAQREDAVTTSGARRMYTDATYFASTHRVFARTRTWNAVKLTGFTGGVAILFLNKTGHAIGASGVHRFGVDGAWIGTSDRRDTWEEYIDPNLPWVPQIGGISILHTHAGVNRLEAIIPEVIAAIETVGQAYARLEGAKPSD